MSDQERAAIAHHEDDLDETCPFCMGEGGWHDCGEDTCCCLDDGPNVACPECHGNGFLPTGHDTA